MVILVVIVVALVIGFLVVRSRSHKGNYTPEKNYTPENGTSIPNPIYEELQLYEEMK